MAGHRDARLAEQSRRLQAGQVDRQTDVADVGAAVVQDGHLVGPVCSQHLDGEVGMRIAEREHRPGDRKAGHEANGERRLRAGGLCDAAPSRVGAGQQQRRSREQLDSGLG